MVLWCVVCVVMCGVHGVVCRVVVGVVCCDVWCAWRGGWNVMCGVWGMGCGG